MPLNAKLASLSVLFFATAFIISLTKDLMRAWRERERYPRQDRSLER